MIHFIFTKTLDNSRIKRIKIILLILLDPVVLAYLIISVPTAGNFVDNIVRIILTVLLNKK